MAGDREGRNCHVVEAAKTSLMIDWQRREDLCQVCAVFGPCVHPHNGFTEEREVRTPDGRYREISRPTHGSGWGQFMQRPDRSGKSAGPIELSTCTMAGGRNARPACGSGDHLICEWGRLRRRPLKRRA